MPVKRRRHSLIIATCAALLVGSLASLTPAPALAAQRHAFSQAFGSAGSGAGQLALRLHSFPGDRSYLAVNDATHDIYVADTGNDRVDQFSASGAFIRAWGWGVADGREEFETCTSTSGCRAGISGSGVGQFAESYFVAVDNSTGPFAGDVYVADAQNRVSKFTATGEPIAAWANGGHLDGSSTLNGRFNEIGGIAVGVSGNLLVLRNAQASPAFNQISVFTSSGGFDEEFSLEYPASAHGIAIDNSSGPSSGDIYTLFSSEVETLKLSPAGVLLGEPDVARAAGLAVDSTSGDLYVSHAGNVAAYDPLGAPLEQFGSSASAGGALQEPAGLAVDSSDHTVYLADAGAQRIDAFTPLTLPTVSIALASNSQPESATLDGTLNPGTTTPDGEVTACNFEYVDNATFQSLNGALSPDEIYASFGSFAPCLNPDGTTTTPLAPDTADHPVHADVAGLQPGTAYDVRLRATNANGTETSSRERFSTQFAFIPPSIEATFATGVTATSADLRAQLNPNHYATSYRFEYVDDATYQRDLGGGDGFQQATRVPADEAALSASGSPQSVQQHLQGLTASTSYRYRLVAHNGHGGLQTSPVEVFSTQGGAAAALADGRQWELVSPPDKHGALFEAMTEEGGVIQAAADGGGLAYLALAPADPNPAGSRSAFYTQLLASRGATGWSTQDIATPHRAAAGAQPGFGQEYKLFSTGLSRGAVEPQGATPLSSEATEKTPYIREANGEYFPLVTGAMVPAGIKFGGSETAPEAFFPASTVKFEAATPDLSVVLLSSPQPLTSDFSPAFAPGTNDSVYEDSGGALGLVSQIPRGTANACGNGSPTCVPAAEEGVDASAGVDHKNLRHAISEDGSRVVFTTEGNGNQVLYLRGVKSSETIRLDVPQAGAEGGVNRPLFQDASVDDSRVFFTDTARLTTDSGAAEGRPDLYMCQIEEAAGHLACILTDLTPRSVGGESANVQGTIVGASADGSTVYFVADGDLDGSGPAVAGDCVALSEGGGTGTCNLYRRNVTNGVSQLVGVLAGNDNHDWAGAGDSELLLTARISPNGRYLAFMSERSLTGYDNRDAASGRQDEEVYRYDSQAAPGRQLVCASCNPTGARPHGIFDPGVFPGLLVDRLPRSGWPQRWLAASIPGWTAVDLGHSLYQSRYLSDSGRLFFNAADSLVPQDSNGVEDVYEYESPTVTGGDCATSSATYSPASGGCVSLISAGTSSEESAFIDASESGADVFFLTTSKLVGSDVDASLDVYDAHACSAASPCPQPPPPTPPACAGDACQNPVSPPNDLTPGSLTFHGPGNVKALPPKPAVKAKARPLTRAQKLAKAVRACKKAKSKPRRATCETQARRKYGITHKAKPQTNRRSK